MLDISSFDGLAEKSVFKMGGVRSNNAFGQ